MVEAHWKPYLPVVIETYEYVMLISRTRDLGSIDILSYFQIGSLTVVVGTFYDQETAR